MKSLLISAVCSLLLVGCGGGGGSTGTAGSDAPIRDSVGATSATVIVVSQ